MKVVVAMSGGVDSSVAAGLLVEAGHEVIGLAMRTHTLAAKSNRACCTPDDMRDARKVADLLGIRFYVLDYEQTFVDEVVRPFAQAYRQGQTPNPCVTCNDRVKFRPLLKQAKLLGADRLATGHYARVVTQNGLPYLARAQDPHKDQAYFLYRLSPEQLAEVLFPVGHLPKSEVRAHAERMGLPVAHKAESQEICFVGPAGYAATVEKVTGAQGGTASLPAGEFVDLAGRVLGRHAGIHHFTLGQRRGLGLSAPEPLYVIDIQPDSHRVVVGPKEALLGPEVALQDVVWAHGPPEVGAVVQVQRRHRGALEPAVLQALGQGSALLSLVTPAPRAAPGQAVVVLDGARVLGGGSAAAKTPALPILAS
jgi:tRNA-specific 2-thiouridylase